MRSIQPVLALEVGKPLALGLEQPLERNGLVAEAVAHRDRVGLSGRDLEEVELAEDAQLPHRILEHQLRLVGSGRSRLAKAGDAVGLDLAFAQRAASPSPPRDRPAPRSAARRAGAVAEPGDLDVLGQRVVSSASIERRELGDQVALVAIAGEQPQQRQQRRSGSGAGRPPLAASSRRKASRLRTRERGAISRVTGWSGPRRKTTVKSPVSRSTRASK